MLVYIEGNVKEPRVDELCMLGEAYNKFVTSWTLSSMEPEVSEVFFAFCLQPKKFGIPFISCT